MEVAEGLGSEMINAVVVSIIEPKGNFATCNRGFFDQGESRLILSEVKGNIGQGVSLVMTWYGTP